MTKDIMRVWLTVLVRSLEHYAYKLRLIFSAPSHGNPSCGADVIRALQDAEFEEACEHGTKICKSVIEGHGRDEKETLTVRCNSPLSITNSISSVHTTLQKWHHYWLVPRLGRGSTYGRGLKFVGDQHCHHDDTGIPDCCYTV